MRLIARAVNLVSSDFPCVGQAPHDHVLSGIRQTIGVSQPRAG
ncbi:hypothetical protein P0E83_13630 [Enterococcus faecalis]|nr:hypothetical protein [Enterococcus faecalis]